VHGRSLYHGPANARARQRNEMMGFVFQHYFLLPDLTALENVLLPALIGGRKAEARARELLERVGLAERMDHLPTELSGGEQQRVAIARALVNDPGILFADEPTGNLDAATGSGVMDMLMNVVEESGKTLIVVTHDPNLARRGDRLLRLKDGLLEPG
jgi:predicted ABC-type transport system involved in lysophospholipase L1 biosynthesis ATPase subunit